MTPPIKELLDQQRVYADHIGKAADALLSENEALRAALETLADGSAWQGFTPNAQVPRMREYARARLAALAKERNQ